MHDIPLERDEQTPLDEPIKIRFTGRLRGRITERHGAYTSDEANRSHTPRAVSVYRALTRQKTNVVLETVEESEAFVAEMHHYCDPSISWMNGAMVRCARRVRSEAKHELAGRTDGDA